MNATTKQLIVASIGLVFTYVGAVLRMGMNNWLLDAAIRIVSLGQSYLSGFNKVQATEALSSIGMAVLWTGLMLIVAATVAWLFSRSREKDHETHAP